jgi:hypothetical protein
VKVDERIEGVGFRVRGLNACEGFGIGLEKLEY